MATSWRKCVILDANGYVPASEHALEAAVYSPSVTKTYADFQPSPANNVSITLFTLPGGFVIDEIRVKHSTAFTGTALATAVVSVGVSGGSNYKFTNAFDVMQATGNTKAQVTSGSMGCDSSSSATIQLTITTTGMANGVDDLTAGSVTVDIRISKSSGSIAGIENWLRIPVSGVGGTTPIYIRGNDFSNGNIVQYDSTNRKFTGIVPAYAPDNAQYLTLLPDGTLTNERVFNPRYHQNATDGGTGANYDLDVQYFGHAVHEFFDDLESIGRGTSLGTFAVGTGAGVTTFNASNLRAGVADCATGTDTTGYAGVSTDYLAYLASGGAMIFEAYISLSALSDIITPQSYILRAGFGDANNADFTDGVYFEYDLNLSANWRYATAAAGTRTKTNSATAVAVAWTRLKIVVNAAGTSAEYFVNGTSIGTQTTNIPTVASQEFGAVCHIVKESGTTSRSMYVDYVGVRKVFDAVRSANW